MHYGYPPHSPSPEDRTVIVCGACRHHTKEMTKVELGAFGVPWYCDSCGATMSRFATFAPHERDEAFRFLGIGAKK